MGNFIHPTAVIDKKASIGEDNYFGPYCVVGPNVIIGDNNRFEAFASVGLPAQHRDYFLLPAGPAIIGNNNVIREYVTINGGTTATTQVGNNCSLLIGSHIGHDIIIKNNVNLGNHTNIGGHSVICDGVNLGLSVVVHQFRIIGAYTMIGMNSTVTRDIPPFVVAYGSPCRARRLNCIGLERSGVSTKYLKNFENWFAQQENNYDLILPVNHSYDKYIQDFINCKNPEKNKKTA